MSWFSQLATQALGDFNQHPSTVTLHPRRANKRREKGVVSSVRSQRDREGCGLDQHAPKHRSR
jgi:hypothetical protein